MYHKAIEAPGVKDKLQALFSKIDVDNDGSLEVDELDEIIGFYQGATFDADEVGELRTQLPPHTEHPVRSRSGQTPRSRPTAPL